MNGQFEREILNLFVAKRRNIGRRPGARQPAAVITYVLRLDIDNFSSQPDSPQPAAPRLLQRLPSGFAAVEPGVV